MSVQENLLQVKEGLKKEVTLVAVSKTKPDELLVEAYDAGQRIFGENKVQELSGKAERLPKDIEWHFIGHLQSNKVKYIAPYVSLIHSVDSLKLMKEINKQAKKHDRVIDCLLQFHVAQEETKFGLTYTDAETLLQTDEFKQLENIRIVGIMGMASNVDIDSEIKAEFRTLKNIFDQLKQSVFPTEASFKEISMGMSGDYKLAMEEGSTMVRVGSTIFGARNYNKA